jgi:membrane fusion protein, multidrug efflux system
MKRFLVAVFVLVVFGGGGYWFVHRGAATEEPAAAQPAAHVEVAPLQRQPIARTLSAFGVVGSAPSSDVAISAPFDCLVRAVYMSVGSRVAAGDVLLEIEPTSDTKLAVASARTALTLAEKTVLATQERYDLKLATNQDLLAAKQTADDARLKVASFEARGLGGDGRILAPAAGVVNRLDLSPGALALTGTVLVTVAAADKLEARLGVEIAQLAEVHAGQAVTLVSANRPDVPPVASTVRAAGGTIDATMGTAEVRVGLPAGAPLYFGEHVQAAIVIEQAEGLVAPRSAVLPDEGKQVLFTVKDGKAVRHEVKIGMGAGDRVQVVSDDLRAGDSVVTLGNYELTDGMAIQRDEKGPGSAEKTPSAPEAKP